MIFSAAKSIHVLKDDINVNQGLAAALYYGGRSIGDKIVPLQKNALDRLEEEAKNAQAHVNVNKDVAAELDRRYQRGRINVQRTLAYYWALESLRPQDRIRPEHDTPLDMAERYAETAFKRPREILQISCTDDDQRLFDEDTYALVKLAIQAKNVRTHLALLDKEEVRKAKWLLEDARAVAVAG